MKGIRTSIRITTPGGTTCHNFDLAAMPPNDLEALGIAVAVEAARRRLNPDYVDIAVECEPDAAVAAKPEPDGAA